MVPCIPKSKHVKLTQACYPKSKTAEAKPNSSELQYLAYYAASRPKKLIKVGAYLRNKTTKDAHSRRQGDVVVSLDILTTLIERCHNNLNLLASDVVAILRSVFETRDISMIEHSQACFASFCKYHDGSALETSPEYSSNYDSLLKHCEEMCRGGEPTGLIGLTMLSHASTSPAMRGQKQQLPLLLSAALECLITSKQENLFLAKQSIDRQAETSSVSRDSVLTIRTKSTTDAQLTDQTTYNSRVTLAALSILRTMFQNNDAMRIRHSAKQLLQYNPAKLDARPETITILVQIVAEWVPIDLRYHVLAACLEYLEQSDLSTRWPNTSQNLAIHNVYVLLTSKISLIGMSTTDVLETLLSITHKLLQSSHFQSLGVSKSRVDLFNAPGENVPNPEFDFLREICSSMVALTAHSYYRDQTSDLFRTIMQRLSILGPSTGAEIHYFKAIHLNVALRIIMESELKKDATELRSIITPMAIVPGLRLLKDPTPARIDFANLVLAYLKVECIRKGSEIPASTREARDASHPIQSALYHYIHNYNADLNDFGLGLEIVKHVHLALPTSEVARFIPLLYRLDTELRSNMSGTSSTSAYRQGIVEAVTVLMAQCGINVPTTQGQYSGASHESLPDLRLVLDSLINSRSNSLNVSREELTEPTWIEEHENEYSGNLGRALSIRQGSRTRLVSSATASRDNLVITSPSIQNPMVGRVAVLKQSLGSKANGGHAGNAAQISTVTSIDDMFQGIELDTVMDTKSQDVINKPLTNGGQHANELAPRELQGTTNGTVQKLELPNEFIPSESTQLGAVIA